MKVLFAATYVCSVLFDFAAIELSAEIAALQIAVLNTRQELENCLKNKQTLGERVNPSVGKGGKLIDSTVSQQEETKVTPDEETQ